MRGGGLNIYGELGLGHTRVELSPITVPGLSNVKQLVVGCDYSLVLLMDGTVKAWGRNDYGQLGTGNTVQQISPVTVPNLTNVKQVAASMTGSFALLTDGTVKAWGKNDYGQLGIGNTTTQLSPVTVPNLASVKQLEAGSDNGYHALALLTDGTVKAWGCNTSGELGIGNTTTQLSPVTVPNLYNVEKLIGGCGCSFAILTDGTVKAWGNNDYGQLGIGNTTNQLSPVTVTGLSNPKQLASGGYHALALLTDGTVKAWGKNDYRQLGIGNTTTQLSPVAVPNLTNVKQLVGGCTHSLALLTDGTVKAWGLNWFAQLGIGNTNLQDSLVTVQISGVVGGLAQEILFQPPYLQPSGTSSEPAITNTLVPTLSWAFADHDTTGKQSAYQVRIHKAEDNSIVHDTDKVISEQTSYEVPADTLEPNTLYSWTVEYWDNDGLPNDTSATAQYFRTPAVPMVSPLSPLGGYSTPANTSTVPRLTWSYNDPEKHAQTKVQIRILNAADNSLAYESAFLSLNKPYYDLPVDVKLEVGKTYTWQVQAIDSTGMVSPWTDKQYFAPATLSPTFSLLADTPVTTGETVVVTLRLDHAENVYAEDVSLQYDTNLFILKSVEAVHEGIHVRQQPSTAEDTIRLIIASKGVDHEANTQTPLVKLFFQAKETPGKGTIAVVKGRIADEFGVEQDTDVTSIEMEVIYDADVSGDGTFSLGDVAIVAAHYGRTEAEWTNPKVDINNDDNIDTADLDIIIDKLLQS